MMTTELDTGRAYPRVGFNSYSLNEAVKL